MQLTLDPEMEKVVQERIRSGKYGKAEDVIRAALTSLKQQEEFGDFTGDELEDLLAEGERSIETEGTLDGEEALRRRQARRAQRRQAAP